MFPARDARSSRREDLRSTDDLAPPMARAIPSLGFAQDTEGTVPARSSNALSGNTSPLYQSRYYLCNLLESYQARESPKRTFRESYSSGKFFLGKVAPFGILGFWMTFFDNYGNIAVLRRNVASPRPFLRTRRRRVKPFVS